MSSKTFGVEDVPLGGGGIRLLPVSPNSTLISESSLAAHDRTLAPALLVALASGQPAGVLNRTIFRRGTA